MHVYKPLCLTDLLRHNDGIVLAEDHEDRHTLHFLASQAKAMKAAGVEVGFLEMFDKSAHCREMLAEFNRTGIISQNIHDWIIRCDPIDRTVEDYVNWLRALYMSEIKVEPLDEIRRSSSLNPLNNANLDWQKTVNTYLNKSPCKFFMLVGKSHTQLTNKYESGEHIDPCVGIDSLLNIPCVLFYPSATSVRGGHGVPTQDTAYADVKNTYRMRIPLMETQLLAGTAR